MGRPTRVLLACLAGQVMLLAGGASASDGRALHHASVSGLGRQRGGIADDFAVVGTGTVSFSAVVNPDGRATTAYFEFGLGTQYREPRPSRVVYDESTPGIHLAAVFGPQPVSGMVSGLVPNALYNLRLVASSSAGTVYSPDSTFRTKADPAPPSPDMGATVNVAPVSGVVLFRPPRNNSSGQAHAARLVQGSGFLPITEPRQLPTATEVDARAGTIRLVVASPQRRARQRLTLGGGLFSLSQTREGAQRGLTTVRLLEGDFPGAPTYESCLGFAAATASNTGLGTTQSSGRVLQTVRAHDHGGRFRTLGRYSESTASRAGAVWDTSDLCDGTLTVVRHGTVVVSDLGGGTQVVVTAGQQYLARPSASPSRRFER